MRILETTLTLTLCTFSFACQFDERCGKDDLVYARGLCSAPPPEAGAPMPPKPAADSGMSNDAAVVASPCEGACELIGRCIAENPMTSEFLADQLPQLGFAGTDRAGCVTYCDANRGGAGDEAVLACFDAAELAAMCGSSTIGDSLPAVQAVDTCCKGRADSEYCVAVCTTLSTNMAAYGFVPNCKDVVP